MAQQPVGERLARAARRGSSAEAGQAVGHAELVAPGSGNCARRKLPARWKGAGSGPASSRESRPSGPRKTTSGSRRNRSRRCPTRRQKSARFVQQAMLTCWQLSTGSPVAGSVNELARPPSRGRLSSSVILSPRSDQRRGGRQARPGRRRRSPRAEAARLAEQGGSHRDGRLDSAPRELGVRERPRDRGTGPGASGG